MLTDDDLTDSERATLDADTQAQRAKARRNYVIDQATDCTECCYSRELCTCREFSPPKEPYDGDDGEVFRGNEADSYEREQMAEWQRLK